MTRKRKTLQELTITDGFMFGAVMLDEENCRGLLERILEIPIGRIEVIREKSLVYHPEYRGIRLDVYARDEEGRRYDVEMQVRTTPVGKRSRYYHSQMDMEMLLSGISYSRLPDSIVIFICCYDPFGCGKYRYTIDNRCKECPDLDIKDGVRTIILNNKGMNPEEVPTELVSFLEFTKKSLAESEEESGDPYIRRLQDTIHKIKDSRDMGEKYMTMQELLQEEREEGRLEGREEGRLEERRELLFNLVSDGLLTVDQAAEKMGVSPDDFRSAMRDYPKKQS